MSNTRLSDENIETKTKKTPSILLILDVLLAMN